MQTIIRNKWGRNAHSRAMAELLGLREGQKLPVEGLPMREIQGVRVYVRPLTGEAPRAAMGRALRRCNHRVRALCPHCGADISAGRLFQHVTVHEAGRPPQGTKATRYIREAAQRATNSRATVEINRSLEWVSISWPDSEGAFMQGDEAGQFIGEVDALMKRYPSLDEDTAALSLAWPYVENLS